MTFVFVTLVFIGLLAAVRVMLYGVERQRPVGDQGPRSFSLSAAVAAGFSVTTGVVGYLLLRSGLSPTMTVFVAIVSGLLAAAGTARAVKRWWTVIPEHDVDDERYILQGSLAHVVADIAERGVGQVSLISNGGPRVLPARTIDQQSIVAGTEVVIERIEDGVAVVEDWTEVEKRL